VTTEGLTVAAKLTKLSGGFDGEVISDAPLALTAGRSLLEFEELESPEVEVTVPPEGLMVQYASGA